MWLRHLRSRESRSSSSDYARRYPHPHPFPTRRSSDLVSESRRGQTLPLVQDGPTHFGVNRALPHARGSRRSASDRSEEHTSVLQSRENLVCRLLLEKKNSSSPIRHWTW